MPDHNPDAARRRIEAALQRELALTRKAYRVRAACAAMQGIRTTLPVGRTEYEDVARMAVRQADALLKELGL